MQQTNIIRHEKTTITFLFFPFYVFAQNDSIAIEKIKELGVYYFYQSDLKKIEPITSNGISAGLTSGSKVYEGANSTNIVEESPVFYVYIPNEYLSKMSFNKFKMVTLSKSGNTRKLKTVRSGFMSVSTGAKSEGMVYEKLADNLCKYYINEALTPGNYGLFYDQFGGIPLKLYDFDVEKK